jgi:hypothetical protein
MKIAKPHIRLRTGDLDDIGRIARP